MSTTSVTGNNSSVSVQHYSRETVQITL